jgi:quercetin dioxygenase-like cupin family protein
MSQNLLEKGWIEALRDELEQNANNGRVGSRLVSETAELRVWQIKLEPGERLPFHRHVLSYFWTVLTDGTALSHYGDGRITEMRYHAGDTKHFTFGLGESMIHDLQNTGNSSLLFTTVEFLTSGNTPFPIE